MTKFSTLIDPASLAPHIASDDWVVVDCRFDLAQPEAGEQWYLEGHIPGAPPQEVVMYCGSGVTACHNLLALEHAGLPGARIFPGSWSEWSADPSRPVATGD